MVLMQIKIDDVIKFVPFITWFVGPIAAYYITRQLQKRDKNKGYRRASKKIVTLLKPIVLEERKFSIDIVNSLINSVSREDGIEKDKMDTVSDILDDLILDIVESGFVTNDKKVEISETIRSMKIQEEKVERSLPIKYEVVNDEKSKQDVYAELAKREQESKFRLWIVIGVIYLILALVVFAGYQFITKDTIGTIGESPIDTILLIVGALIITIHTVSDFK